MSWNVTIRPQAKADLRRAHDWYEERCAGLGELLGQEQSGAMRLRLADLAKDLNLIRQARDLAAGALSQD
ncbi:MAG: hypothetical protein P4N60_04640 [Verrucomicrobiae bacterium]|nr:hypothetical protein [Verrucomicrobiae bacterium]